MGKFNKFDKGGRGFGGGKSFGGGHGGPRQMFPATCSECGQSCEVPFRPSGDRPVLCNACFKGGNDHGNKFAPKKFDRDNRGQSFAPKFNAPAPSGITKAQFDALAAKVDKILSILSAAEIEPAEIDEEIIAKPKKTSAKKEVKKEVKKPAKKAKAKKK